MKPTLGRIVHYQLHADQLVVALITRFEGDTVWLTYFEAGEAPSFAKSDFMAAGPREAQLGQWFWPERI